MQGYSELVWFNDYFILDTTLFCSCARANEGSVGGYEVFGMRRVQIGMGV